MTLHLTIKKKWFDMIASGEKKEEYREIKHHWWRRLVFNYKNLFGALYGRDPEGVDVKKRNNVVYEIATSKYSRHIDLNDFDFVEFRNGYSKNARSLTVECIGIEIREGREEWGAEKGEKYFVIKLGKIIHWTDLKY